MLKRFEKSTLVFLGAALGLFLVIQLLLSFGVLNDFWYTIVRNAAVLAMVALGLNLIYGFNGQFSLGQWGFYAIGAYSAADITYRWANKASADGLVVVLLGVIFSAAVIFLVGKGLGTIRGIDPLSQFAVYLLGVGISWYLAVLLGGVLSPAVSGILGALPANISTQIVFVFAVLLAGCLSAIIAFLFGLPIFTLGSDYFGIATLGFTIIVKVLLDNSDTMLGFEEMKGARGMIGIPQLTNWFWVFLFLFVIIVITRNLLQSTHGRALVSVREDEIAAKAMGINVAGFKNLTFILGSLFAGVAGALYAHIQGFLHPNTFNFINSFNPLIIVVFGGLGSVTGTIFAAFAWSLVLEGVLRLVLPDGFETWRFVIYPVLLLVMMLLKPKGLLGGYEIPFLRHKLPPLKLGKATSPTPENVPVRQETESPGITTSAAESKASSEG